MATTDKVVSFERKMLVSRERWGDNFLTYLRQEIESVTKSVFFSGGVVEDATIGITSSTNDTFTLDTSSASRVCDGLGHVMDLASLPSGDITDYPFENTNLDTYFVGIRFQSVADTVERNPRTALPQYVLTEDTIGELGDPDSVADNTTFIRLVVDGLLEASIDHSGRPVKVYLKTPVSPTASVAFHTGTVAFTGGLNVIDIPYTVAQGPLGQTAPSFPISLTAADYTVHVEGPSWFGGTDLRLDPTNYAFVGIITGNGPAATPTGFDISDQNTVFLLSLDKAYRAGVTTTPAPGRSILVDKWAMELDQSATTQRQQDPANTPLLISKIGETINGGSAKIVETPWDTKTFGTWDLQVMSAGVGSDLQPTETVNVATATITFTRGAINLTGAEVSQFLRELTSHVRITGSALGNDGLYVVSAVASSATLNVTELDGTSPGFSAESGLTATVYMTSNRRATVPDPLAVAYSGETSWEHQFPVTGRGLLMRMFGDPLGLAEANINPFLQGDWFSGSGDSTWMRWFPGQLQMRGGGNLNQANKHFGEGDDRITGTGAIQIDKRDDWGLHADWQAQEADLEWGFDYRGNDFGKDLSTNESGIQLSGSLRHPWTDYDGGNENIHASEAFTQASASTITLTRVGADVANVPADASNLANFVLAELEYSTANAADGIYWVSAKVGSDVLALKKLDGGNPAITAGSGTVRLYGGSFFGPLPIARGAAGIRPGWIHSLVQPTTEGGGLLHMTHRYPSRTAANLHAVSATGPDSTDITWALKGSMMFAKSISTNIANVPPADDSIGTGLIHATIIDLDASAPRELSLPTTISDTDVIVRSGGGTWTITRVINRFRGQAWSNQSGGTFSVGESTWGPNDSATTQLARSHDSQTPGSVEAYYWIPLNLPQGCTFTEVDVRVTPVIGDGTGNAFGIRVLRKQWDLTTNESLRGTSVVRASGGATTLQTVNYVADQNQVIDNATYEYYLGMEKSITATATADLLYGIRVTFTVASLGQSLFDCI